VLVRAENLAGMRSNPPTVGL